MYLAKPCTHYFSLCLLNDINAEELGEQKMEDIHNADNFCDMKDKIKDWGRKKGRTEDQLRKQGYIIPNKLSINNETTERVLLVLPGKHCIRKQWH